jgi:hypothetical protein
MYAACLRNMSHLLRFNQRCLLPVAYSSMHASWNEGGTVLPMREFWGAVN